MDAGVEILLPAGTDLQSFGFKVPTYHWDGVDYPQGPPECEFGKNFKLTLDDRIDFRYYKEKLPEKYQNIKWQIIDISGEGLDIYSKSLFEFQEEEKGDGLKDLIILLLTGKPQWVFVFTPQFDSLRDIYAGEMKDIMIKLEHAVKEGAEGFLIYH